MSRQISVPFFRPDLADDEIDEVVATLRSGWLTTGPRTMRFEQEFAEAVGASHAVAMNSCTAALHLGTVALGLAPGQGVLVPTMTFAATAEVVRYSGAVPILVDCDPISLEIDSELARGQLEALRAGRLPDSLDPDMPVVGMMPVHVAGRMIDMDSLGAFARQHDLWQVEDAAHAFPAAYRSTAAPADKQWRRCGEGTAEVSCFSFYANKTITTGEGGMAVTQDEGLAAEMRSLSLHGLSNDAWGRYTAKGSWDYRILAPGYKYNLTDIASALGLRQLAKAEDLRLARERIARDYLEKLANVDELELPPVEEDRHHSWHLFQIRLRLELLDLDRDAFLEGLRERGVGYSVHWRPLHLHPYYAEAYGWRPEHLPAASAVWQRTVSLPIFPSMRNEELDHVVATVSELCRRHRRSKTARRPDSTDSKSGSSEAGVKTAAGAIQPDDA